MAVKLIRPSNVARVEFMPKTASTAITANSAVYLSSGKVTPVTSGANGEAIEGICLREVAATDSDYASETKVPVLIDPRGEWEIDLSSSTNTITAGGYLDWNNSTTVHVSNSTYDSIRALQSTSNASKLRCQIVLFAETYSPAVDA